jgi:Uma2 family endonuclease
MTLSQAFPRRLLTGDQVIRMVESGILDENDPFELLGGELIAMTPQGPPHASLIEELRDQLKQVYGASASVREEKPLDCGPHDLPEPDLAVIVGGRQQYRQQHPRGAETQLVIEVAWSSQAIDRAKASIYASASVPVYWLIDVPGRRVEVYTQPQPNGSYTLVTLVNPGDTLTPPGTNALWALDALLP